MSIIVEETEAAIEPITENQELPAEEVVAAEEAEETPEAEEQSYEVPEKYAGKTLEDVITMHQNAQRKLSEQGQEVGEQRKMIQQLLELQQASMQQQTTNTEPEIEEDFQELLYDNPKEAIAKIVASHPEILAAKEANMKAAQQSSIAQLEAKHPEFRETIQDNKFLDWVQGSPVRTELFRRANDNYDVDSASELFDTWKTLSMIDKTNEVKKKQQKTRDKELLQTSSETRSSGDSVGGKKIYRRSDLIELQRRDPEYYASNSDEIMQAYAEGRVR